MRWQLEVTFQEVRRHLGFETQRHSGRIFGDTKNHPGALRPVLARDVVIAHQRMRQGASTLRKAAWYHKAHPTFAEALALVGKELWAQEDTFRGSVADTETVRVPQVFIERLTDALCYAA